MAFIPKTISIEDSIGLKNSLQGALVTDVAKTNGNLQNEEEPQEDPKETKEKKEKKPRKKAPKRVDWEEKIKEANINEEKWRNYKKITLIKPLDMVDGYDVQNVAVPQHLLRRLNNLTRYNSSIHMKTIVTNLIIDFLESNKDIVELMENEYNKKSK